MYRVMVVDDEPIVRESLKTFPWEQWGCQASLWADDGEQALALFDRYRPDVVISDIRMPQMDGLELAREIKKRFPEAEVILLTGYAQFEYAKEALSLGVREYLLKPFRIQDVEEALGRTLTNIETRREGQRRAKQAQERLDQLSPFLKNQVYQELLEGKVCDCSDKTGLLNIRPTRYIVASTQGGRDGEREDEIYQLFKEKVKGMEKEIYLARGVDIISLILCFDLRREEKMSEQAALQICRFLQEAAMERLGRSISFGISCPTADMRMLHRLKEQSVRALNSRQSLEKAAILFYSGPQKESRHGPMNLAPYEKQIEKCVVSGKRKEMEEVFQAMLQELLEAAQGDFLYVKRTLLRLVVLAFRVREDVRQETGGDYEGVERLLGCESMENLAAESLQILTNILKREPVSLGEGIGEQVRAYMECHLGEELSLEGLSTSLHYSPAYLSRLLKKNTGQTFSELLQGLRLRRAKLLLKTTDERVGGIAARVGYSDVSYFISVFKKQNGVTPSEYRSLAKLEEL